MICPNCELAIDDTSSACPHCGADIERKYCPTCGQSIGTGGNKKGVMLFVSFVLTALVLVFIINKTADFSIPKLPNPEPKEETNTPRPDERYGYEIITKNSISIGETATEEWMIHIDSSNQNNIINTGLQAIEEAQSKGSFTQITVYIYVGDDYAVDQSKWTANITYIRPDYLESGAVTLIEGSENIGDNVYARWQ